MKVDIAGGAPQTWVHRLQQAWAARRLDLDEVSAVSSCRGLSAPRPTAFWSITARAEYLGLSRPL